MFGKKKTVVLPAATFRCGVCGLDCVDQHSLERHASWSHAMPVAEAPHGEPASVMTAKPA